MTEYLGAMQLDSPLGLEGVRVDDINVPGLLGTGAKIQLSFEIHPTHLLCLTSVHSNMSIYLPWDAVYSCPNLEHPSING